ncbi:MAG: amidohydrolase family protein [Planctomycetota bacterium]
MSHLLVLAALASVCAAAEPPTAIVNARLIDGTGAPVRLHCTVLVRGERIAAVGPGVAVPADARVVDGKGMTLLPGMFDTHGHCFTVDGKDQYEAYPLLFLAGGVTTTFSPGEMDPGAAYALRARLARNEQQGARLLTAGPYFEKGQGELTWLVGYTDEAQALAWLAEHGPRMDGLKLQMQITEAEAKAILDDAHRRGIRVTGHLGSVTATRAIELGIDRLEHGLFAMSEFAPWQIQGLEQWADKFRRIGEIDLDGPVASKLIDLIVEKQVALSATTVSFTEWAPGFEPVTPDWEKYLAPEIRRLQKARMLRIAALPADQGKCFAAGVKKQLEFCKRVHDRGGIVVTGTDPGGKLLIPGYGLHRELRLLVDAGFTPLAALRAATQHAARTLGVEKDLGTIEAGKLADLVLVEGDPSTDIAAIGNTRTVWKAGVAFDPIKLRSAAEGKIR